MVSGVVKAFALWPDAETAELGFVVGEDDDGAATYVTADVGWLRLLRGEHRAGRSVVVNLSADKWLMALEGDITVGLPPRVKTTLETVILERQASGCTWEEAVRRVVG